MSNKTFSVIFKHRSPPPFSASDWTFSSHDAALVNSTCLMKGHLHIAVIVHAGNIPPLKLVKSERIPVEWENKMSFPPIFVD